jgi:peptide-methionine (R)-S-oxide reductase
MRFRRRPPTARPVERSDAEWRAELTDEQYRVLRRKGTEAPFTGPYLHPEPGATGMLRCAGCGAELFNRANQFDSGTGWPSFVDADPAAVELRRDLSRGIPRTEIVCRRCGSHLGHLFRDGPRPTGLRYCINGCALTLPDEPDAP